MTKKKVVLSAVTKIIIRQYMKQLQERRETRKGQKGRLPLVPWEI